METEVKALARGLPLLSDRAAIATRGVRLQSPGSAPVPGFMKGKLACFSGL